MPKLNQHFYLHTSIHGVSMSRDLIRILKVNNVVLTQKWPFSKKVLSLEPVYITLVQCSIIRAIQMLHFYPLAWIMKRFWWPWKECVSTKTFISLFIECRSWDRNWGWPHAENNFKFIKIEKKLKLKASPLLTYFHSFHLWHLFMRFCCPQFIVFR